MFKGRQLSLHRKILRGGGVLRRESYHSFPDADEKPQISTSTANFKKTYDKSRDQGFSIDAKFRLDNQFAGVFTSTAISSQNRPKTLSTKLPNGLTVSSQDSVGLMTTISFLLQVGRSSSFIILMCYCQQSTVY